MDHVQLSRVGSGTDLRFFSIRLIKRGTSIYGNDTEFTRLIMPQANEKYNLFLLKPNLIKEWHPTKNGDLRPLDVTPGSGKKVWWLCSEGHEWQAAIYSRSRGSGCPRCYRRNQIDDDPLMMLNPDLAREWHPTKNGNLRFRDISSNYDQKIWWLCSEGYEWQATIQSRMKGEGCPRCSGRTGQQRSPAHPAEISSGNGIRGNENQAPKNNPNLELAISDDKLGTDFRKNERFLFQDTVILENQNSGQWSYARSVNVSEAGLFFESEIPFNKGVRLTVKFNNPPFESVQETYRSIVRWCKELPYDSTASFYGVGVEFV